MLYETFLMGQNTIPMFHVYILHCADGTLYIGSTNDLTKRVHQHNHAKAGAHYTKVRRPVTLAYSEACDSYAAARTREAVLKRLTRAKKFALIASKSPVA